jgi:hypothetical protein
MLRTPSSMVTIGSKAMKPSLPQLSIAQLLALLHDPREPSIVEIARRFEDVHRLIESLPLTSAAYCFAHNWLRSAQELCQAGEHATARYQVGLVAKKLNLTEDLYGTACSAPVRYSPSRSTFCVQTSWQRNCR